MKSTKKVLIAEDDILLGSIWEECFLQFDTKAVIAKNGAIAHQLLTTEKFDLFITDLDLPIVNGKELIKALQEKKNKTPIVVCSGSSNCGIDLNDIEVDLYLEKPIDITQKCQHLIELFLR